MEDPNGTTLEDDDTQYLFSDEYERAPSGQQSGQNDSTTRRPTEDSLTFDHIQQVALLMAHFFPILCIGLVGLWISQLGGLAWEYGNSKLIFNWHPLLMVLSFLFMTVASLSFRATSTRRFNLPHPLVKLIHGSAWAVAAACLILGLVAVFRSHNDPISGFVANLYSFHSWIGLSVFTVFIVQFLVGYASFGAPASMAARCGITPVLKAQILVVHAYVGPLLYYGVMLTILLGIQEKEGFIGCGFAVDAADTKPWQHLNRIPAACRISHVLGILVLLTGVCTGVALAKNN